MSETIAAALITGTVSLLGSILALISTSRRQHFEMRQQLAIMNTEMAAMKDDIKAHNRYAQLFSENIPAIKQHMTDVDRRLEKMERREI